MTKCVLRLKHVFEGGVKARHPRPRDFVVHEKGLLLIDHGECFHFYNARTRCIVLSS